MIGVIGGYGDIGRNVVRFLDRYGNMPIKIGSRHPEKRLSDKFENDVIYQYVDVNDSKSTGNFLENCTVIINCTGINDETVVKLAELSVKSNCGYVDLCMNKHLEGADSGTVVYGSGSIPGLAELLTIYFGKTFRKAESMNFYYGALGRLSFTAAKDYLDGVAGENNKSMVYWKDGKTINCENFENLETELPFSDSKFMIFPYMDSGTVFVAEELGLDSGKWYMAFSGKRTLMALENSSANIEKSANELSTASELDCMENGKFAGILIEITGKYYDFEETKTLYLRSDDPSKLTGSVAAVTALAIEKKILPSGSYPLYKCRDYGKFIEYLKEFPDVFRIFFADGDKSVFMEDIEGEI